MVGQLSINYGLTYHALSSSTRIILGGTREMRHPGCSRVVHLSRWSSDPVVHLMRVRAVMPARVLWRTRSPDRTVRGRCRVATAVGGWKRKTHLHLPLALARVRFVIFGCLFAVACRSVACSLRCWIKTNSTPGQWMWLHGCSSHPVLLN